MFIKFFLFLIKNNFATLLKVFIYFFIIHTFHNYIYINHNDGNNELIRY